MPRLPFLRGIGSNPSKRGIIPHIFHHSKHQASNPPARPIATTSTSTSTSTMSSTMQVAQVKEWAEGPRLVTVPRPPEPTENEMQLRVLATGLHNVVRSRASGTHYSAKALPHIPGIDGVGRNEATGRLYYFMVMKEGFGTFAEYINVPQEGVLVPLPEDSTKFDAASLAGAVNPAMSSWMAITQRTTVTSGADGAAWSAFIIGSTSASGRLAVHAARALGATRVIGAARDEAALKADTTLDGYVVLKSDPAEIDFSAANGEDAPDVVLDYVYGDVTERYLAGLRARKSVQYVQIGTLSGQPQVPVPGPLLRSTDLTIRGAGPGSWTLKSLTKEMPKLVSNLVTWPSQEAVKIPLQDIEKTWNDRSIKGRIVFTP